MVYMCWSYVFLVWKPIRPQVTSISLSLENQVVWHSVILPWQGWILSDFELQTSSGKYIIPSSPYWLDHSGEILLPAQTRRYSRQITQNDDKCSIVWLPPKKWVPFNEAPISPIYQGSEVAAYPLRQPQPCLLGLNAGSLKVGRKNTPPYSKRPWRWMVGGWKTIRSFWEVPFSGG